mmetsp:Transcript_11403/g.23332  ORF Transcript_11403/g.23332 Transcript_11403/m.23332 type:complete len:167 (+) Transcript_11403:582-1082(+)
MSNQIKKMETAQEPVSALRDNIAHKGRNAYYYAHAHKADGPEWDQKEEPRLLKTESKGEEEDKPLVPASPITDYAYSDEDKKLKIYISLEGVGELQDGDIDLQFTRTSFTLTVMNYKDANHKLAFARLFEEIENCTVKKKPNKLIVVLTKVEEKAWACINAGTPSK